MTETKTAKSVLTAGVDEAGRGPLAGPVVAAAVILDPDQIPEGLRDSKKLTARKRTILAGLIREHAKAYAIGIVHEQDIDRQNILQATFEAMRRAVAGLSIQPDKLLVDGKMTIPALDHLQEAVVGGDDLFPEISAASILAKTTRDSMMTSYDLLFPAYGFASHKGYGSKKHMETLREVGRSLIHRRSFKPVDDCPNKNYRFTDQPEQHGRMGEILAGMFLIRQGYELLAHGYHAGREGEIDLIARQEQTYVFVEVKSFADVDEDTALERVTPAKQKQIADMAALYLQKQDIDPPDTRFDIITINFSNPRPGINHYEDAFLPL